MNEYTFESPVDLVKHLYAGENTPTGICRAPSTLFGWYSRAKRVYDNSLCATCKQNIKEEDVENEYAQIVQYPDIEKRNAVLAVGGVFTLKLRGTVLGKVDACE